MQYVIKRTLEGQDSYYVYGSHFDSILANATRYTKAKHAAEDLEALEAREDGDFDMMTVEI